MKAATSILPVITAPFRLFKFLVDAALSTATLLILGLTIAWSLGYIPQDLAAAFLSDLGERSLELARALGVPI